MREELVRFVDGMDRCWIESRFEALGSWLAGDVVLVAPGGERLEGLESAAQSYREFMSRCWVDRFRAFDHQVTERGDTAIVEYRWEMNWNDGLAHEASGREVLVLARRNGEWRVVWRTQLPA